MKDPDVPSRASRLESVFEELLPEVKTKGLKACIDHIRGAFEVHAVMALLEETYGHISGAARLAQMDESTFYRLVRKHDIRPMVFRDGIDDRDESLDKPANSRHKEPFIGSSLGS